MSRSSVINGSGIVVRAPNGIAAHESIDYDFLILSPPSIAGQTFTAQKPRREFEPGMNIHPAKVDDDVRIVLKGGVATFFVTEWVAFAPCASGSAPQPSMIDRLIRLVRVQLGGATPQTGIPSGGVDP